MACLAPHRPGKNRLVQLRAGGGPCTYVDSQHGPAAVYLITDTVLADPGRLASPRIPNPEHPQGISR